MQDSIPSASILKKRKTVFRQILILIMIFLLLALLIFSWLTVNLSIGLIEPVLNQVADLRFSVVSVYLELEWHYAGHSSYLNQTIEEQIQTLLSLNQTLKDSYQKGKQSLLKSIFISKDKDLTLLNNLVNQVVQLVQDNRITVKQLAPSSPLDIKLSTLIHDFSKTSLEFSNNLRSAFFESQRNSDKIQIILIVFVIGFSIIIILNYRKYEKQLFIDNIALTDLNTQLQNVCQRLSSSEQQLQATNQQLKAQEQQLRASNQQLKAQEQQLRASNQQLNANSIALSISEQRLRKMFENSHNAILILKPLDEGEDFIISEYNPKAELFDQIKKDDIPDKTFSEIFPQLNKTILSEVLKRVHRSGNAESLPAFTYQDIPCNRFRDYYVYKIATNELVVIYSEMTEQKQIEYLLKIYEQAIEHSDELIAAINHKHEFIFVNRAYEDYFQITRSQWAGKSVRDLFTPFYYDEKVKSRIDSCLFGDRIQIEELYEFKELGERYLQISYYPLSIPTIQERIVIKVIKDVSEQRRMLWEQQKAQKIESIGLLAGGIAHDFNNLLQGIFGFMSMARESTELQEVRENLDEALTAYLQAKELTQQLLTFSTGGAPVKTTVSIDVLLKKSIKLALSGSDIQTLFSLDQELWFVYIDEGQIYQVISNLAINARQAMPSGGNIYLRAANCYVGSHDVPELKQGEYVEIIMEDTGIGIPETHLTKIFDPFFTTKQKGSGLGLATAFSIIKKHEGQICVQSELGRGTTFKLYLPRSKEQPDKVQSNFPVSDARGKTVLLMDDEIIVRNMVKKFLEKHGYAVLLAPNGQTAVDIFTQTLKNQATIDAVILDLTIPGGMGGKDTVRVLKQLKPDLQAIVSSGYSDDPVFSDPMAYGFDAVIPKPYKIHELLRLLNTICGVVKNSSPEPDRAGLA